MTTIHVTASREYDVLVQPGLLDDAGAQIARTLGTFQPLEVTVSFVAGKGHWQHKGGVTKQIVPHVWLICDFITCPSKDFLNQLLVRLRTAQLADRNFFQIN